MKGREYTLTQRLLHYILCIENGHKSTTINSWLYVPTSTSIANCRIKVKTVVGSRIEYEKSSSVNLGGLSCYFSPIRNSLWVSGYKYTNNLLSVHTEKAYFFGGYSPANFQHELTRVIFRSYLFLGWRCHAGEFCFSYRVRAPPCSEF